MLVHETSIRLISHLAPGAWRPYLRPPFWHAYCFLGRSSQGMRGSVAHHHTSELLSSVDCGRLTGLWLCAGLGPITMSHAGPVQPPGPHTRALAAYTGSLSRRRSPSSGPYPPHAPLHTERRHPLPGTPENLCLSVSLSLSHSLSVSHNLSVSQSLSLALSLSLLFRQALRRREAPPDTLPLADSPQA